MGCLFQGNLGSFSGYYGSEVKRRAEKFQMAGLYHCLGSDGHSPRSLRRILDEGGKGAQMPTVNRELEIAH